MTDPLRVSCQLSRFWRCRPFTETYRVIVTSGMNLRKSLTSWKLASTRPASVSTWSRAGVGGNSYTRASWRWRDQSRHTCLWPRISANRTRPWSRSGTSTMRSLCSTSGCAAPTGTARSTPPRWWSGSNWTWCWAWRKSTSTTRCIGIWPRCSTTIRKQVRWSCTAWCIHLAWRTEVGMARFAVWGRSHSTTAWWGTCTDTSGWWWLTTTRTSFHGRRTTCSTCSRKPTGNLTSRTNFIPTRSWTNIIFFREFPEDKKKPAYLKTLRLRHRANYSGWYVGSKSIVSPMFCFNLFNHYCWTRLPLYKGVVTKFVVPPMAASHHYRKCGKFYGTGPCEKLYQQKTLDNVMLRFEKNLTARVVPVLKKLGIKLS